MSILDTLITTHENGQPYGVTDLNRVGEALIYVRDFLVENRYGISFRYPVRTDWSEDEVFPTIDDLQALLANIEVVRKTAALLPSMPQTPSSMENLTAAKANDIERILIYAYDTAQNIIAAWFYADEIYAGEVN